MTISVAIFPPDAPPVVLTTQDGNLEDSYLTNDKTWLYDFSGNGYWYKSMLKYGSNDKFTWAEKLVHDKPPPEVLAAMLLLKE